MAWHRFLRWQTDDYVNGSSVHPTGVGIRRHRRPMAPCRHCISIVRIFSVQNPIFGWSNGCYRYPVSGTALLEWRLVFWSRQKPRHRNLLLRPDRRCPHLRPGVECRANRSPDTIGHLRKKQNGKDAQRAGSLKNVVSSFLFWHSALNTMCPSLKSYILAQKRHFWRPIAYWLVQ